MSKKINVVLGAYAHLPSGADEAEFELLYKKEICPLVQALRNFPRINMVFYYSGVILNWIERRHQEFLMLLDDVVANKQIEFLGGGFYNPMFPFITGNDKSGQIEMFNTYLRKQFGKRLPQGCWVPEMAWDQSLVLSLNSSRMHYTFLSERYFSAAGAEPNKAGLFSPCITEDQGRLLTVFPIATSLSETLRNSIIEGVLPLSSEDQNAARSSMSIMKDAFDKLPDGEHTVVIFPFTMDTALPPLLHEQFFRELSLATFSDYPINFITPANLYKKIQERTKLYFPNVWACPHSEQPLSQRQILVKHLGSAAIYSKIMYVHTLIDRLRGDKTRKSAALEELWKAQDSGVFCSGGTSSSLLMKAAVRNAAYRSLLEAEKITREKVKFTPSLSVFDFDLNGEDEYVFLDTKLSAYIRQRGAAIFALDYLPASWNYADIPLPCTEDTEPRRAFVEWFAPEGTHLEDADASGIPGGRFCGNEKYQILETDRTRQRQGFKLPRNPELPFGELELEKTWQLKKNNLTLEYLVRNTATGGKSFVFCPQLDLSFPGENETLLRLFAQREVLTEVVEQGSQSLLSIEKVPFVFGDSVIIRNAIALEFQDILNEALVTLAGSRTFDVKVFHVRSKANAQKEYLSTCIMPFFHIRLEAGKTWKMVFSFKITP